MAAEIEFSASAVKHTTITKELIKNNYKFSNTGYNLWWGKFSGKLTT